MNKFYTICFVLPTVKVWDGLWRLCSTFVGHRGMIPYPAPYAHLPRIISDSMDATIREWNLETLESKLLKDQLWNKYVSTVCSIRVKHKTPVLGQAAQSERIISYSDHKMFSWNFYWSSHHWGVLWVGWLTLHTLHHWGRWLPWQKTQLYSWLVQLTVTSLRQLYYQLQVV